jgi:hypothetical protein
VISLVYIGVGKGLVGDIVSIYIGAGTGLVGDIVRRYRSGYRVSW